MSNRLNCDQLWYVKTKDSECTWQGARISIDAGHLQIFDDLDNLTAAFAPGAWQFVLEDEAATEDETQALSGSALQ